MLRAGEEYFAYGTDGPEQHVVLRETGREIPVLRSPDLENWEFLGGAIEPSENLRGLDFWAPEVISWKNRFLMYYSAGEPEGEGHKLRVAASNLPQGPFQDLECILFPDLPFTIDAHPFEDPRTGDLYLFFCMDFFDEPVGTGIAGALLDADGTAPASTPVPLLRGGADWQIYERNRFWYGQTWAKWHTVEGPFVVYRQDRYWMFFSGGLWKGEGYGIGCAVADSPLGPYVATGIEKGPSVLRTGQFGLRGPGHCSVVVDPDGEDYLAFHAWDKRYERRQLHVLKLTWTEIGPVICDPHVPD